VQPDGTGTIVYYDEQKPAPGDGIAGIDIGIINIAAVTFQNGESILYSGKGILSSDQWYQKRAARCKPGHWAKGKKQEGQSRRNKQYRRKAGNTRRLALHNLTRNIIDECVKRKVGIIVVGDLKGIRKDADHGKSGNQRLHAWPFAEIRRQLKYKAEEVNIRIEAVSERNTSKCCHICGEKGVRNPRGILKCKRCNIAINSDVNGAFNILNKVSPSPAIAGVGVEADFPGLPSPGIGDEISSHSSRFQRIGKVQSFSQIPPTFVAKFDLRNWSIVQTQCN
jgi:putative transposase